MSNIASVFDIIIITDSKLNTKLTYYSSDVVTEYLSLPMCHLKSTKKIILIVSLHSYSNFATSEFPKFLIISPINFNITDLKWHHILEFIKAKYNHICEAYGWVGG